MKYLEVILEMPPEARHPMQEFCRQSETIGRVELVTWNATADDEEYALFHIEGDIDAYRERIDEVDSIRRYNLTPVADGSFYSYVVHEPGQIDRG